MASGAGGNRSLEIRAFRGTRKSSIYRDLRLSVEDFERIVEVARRRGCDVLASLDPRVRRSLDKASARRLADEATRLRETASLVELDGELTAVAEVANWCARATAGSWLNVRFRG